MSEPLHPKQALARIDIAGNLPTAQHNAERGLAFIAQHPIPVDEIRLLADFFAARAAPRDEAAMKARAFLDAWAPEASA